MQFEYELSNGNRIPALGLGTWRLSGEQCKAVVKRALELGYRHIDTAPPYQNQIEIGTAIKDFDRSKIFLTSKVWWTDLRYNDVIEACDITLKELDTDYLDLYLIHWPNEEVPIEETLRAFKTLVDNGKVLNIGVSNFSINQLKEALKVSQIPITINQVEFNPLSYMHQKNLLKFCTRCGIVITAYASVRVQRRDSSFDEDEMINEIANKYGRTAAQIHLKWGLQKGVTVIPKSSSESHLKENLDIFSWKISDEDVKRIDSLNENNKYNWSPLSRPATNHSQTNR